MTDETDADDATITVAEMLEFAREVAQDEADDYEGDVPNHAPSLIASRATDLLQTVANIDMINATDDPLDDERIQTAVEEDAVDILMALGGLCVEYDINIAAAVEDRMDLMKSFQTLREELDDAETQEEAMAVMDEHMTEEMEEMMMGTMGGGAPVEAGTNVDGEDYDHEETDKSFL